MKIWMVTLSAMALFPSRSLADFACRATVSYQWKKEGGEPQSVFYSEAAGSAATEEEGKRLVMELLRKENFKAREACAKRHENLSGCIAAKFEAEASLLSRLGFSARKALEEAIGADCRAAQGTCLDAPPPEVICQEQKAGAAEDKTSAEKGKESAAEKKKGK